MLLDEAGDSGSHPSMAIGYAMSHDVLDAVWSFLDLGEMNLTPWHETSE